MSLFRPMGNIMDILYPREICMVCHSESHSCAFEKGTDELRTELSSPRRDKV